MTFRELLKKPFEYKEFIRVDKSWGFGEYEMSYSVMRESFWKLEVYAILIIERTQALGAYDWRISNKWESVNSIESLIKTIEFKAEKEKPIEKHAKKNIMVMLIGETARDHSAYKTVHWFPGFRKMSKEFIKDIEGHNIKDTHPEYFV